MPNYKMNLIRDLHADVLQFLPDQAAQRVADLLTIRLNDYDINEACHELMVVETESEQMLRNFLATKRIEGRSLRTIQRYGDELSKMIHRIGKPIKDMTIYDLRSYLAQLTLKGLSVNTVAGVRSIMTSFFSWLTNEGYIVQNPAAHLAPIKTEDIERKPFTSTDIDMLRTACTNQRDRAIIEFLRSTGCRISEAVQLNRDAIDWKNNELTVHGKGNKNRVVYIDDICAMHLQRYLASRTDNDKALFYTREKTRITAHGVRGVLKNIGKRAHVENVHPHRFRRTLATNLATRGMPVQDISRILGHSNLDTTMIYVNMSDVNVKMSYMRYSA